MNKLIKNILFIILILLILFIIIYFYSKNKILNNSEKVLPSRYLKQGWYWGSISQKLPGTPSNWVFTGNGSRSDCWHKPDVKCD